MSTFLADRVEDYEAVIGEKVLEKLDYLGFMNSVKAIQLLHKHITGNKPIAVHGDIDVDGIGSSYVLYRFLLSQGVINRVGFIINKEKEHGISEKHVNYFDRTNVGLLIVLDSSTNEVLNIEKMNCDVLVIDHHTILHNELSGKTTGGEYVIVNNMIDNSDVNDINEWISSMHGETNEYVKPYLKEDRMSGCLVLYELLRLYQLAYKLDDLLDNMLLFQWVGITLLTDAVPLSSSRNQYYMDKTVHNMSVEYGLSILMKNLNHYQTYLDKSFINFTLAPTLNKAIRAGESAQALDIVLNRPHEIRKLDTYKDKQQTATENFMANVDEYNTFAMKDITNLNIHKNYCGILATKICEYTRKNTAVYVVVNNIAIGSFRGRIRSIDYRQFFENYEEGIYAQGHKPAFGFKVRLEILKDILAQLHTLEQSVDTRPYLTAGNSLPEVFRGKYHIADMDNFKKQGLLWKLALANSKLSSDESVNILTSLQEAVLIEQKGRVYWYNILGLKCMTFEELTTPHIEIYTEYSKEIKIYAKNVQGQ